MSPAPSNHESQQAQTPKLFDFDGASAADSAEDNTLSVTELQDQVGMAVRAKFRSQVWIRGELTSLRRPGSGIVYFDLTETSAGGAIRKVPVVLFRDRKALVNRRLTDAGGSIRMTDGLAVRIRGRIDFYGPQSTVQVQMTDIDPAYTIGTMAIARDRLLASLAEEGLLTTNRAQAMPRSPLRIGLVTSPGSAAHADFLDELRRSGLSWRVMVAGAQVQGAGAEHSIVSALGVLARSDVSVIALVRGGGARSDLAAFDCEPVARAIAASPVPVLTGIGHEIDDSVADRVASQALKTPTACAAALVELVADSHRRAEAAYSDIVATATVGVDRQERELERLASDALGLARSSIEAAKRDADRVMADIATRALRAVEHNQRRLGENHRRLGQAGSVSTQQVGHRLDAATTRLAQATQHTLTRPALMLDHAEERLRLLNPERLLAQGWSITRTADGSIVRTIKTAPPGTELRTQVDDGVLFSTTSEPAQGIQ